VKHFLLLPVSLLLALMLCAPVTAADVILQSITFEADTASPYQEVVHITMTPLRHPFIFSIQGDSPQVVCDFMGAKPADGIPNDLKVDGRFIQQIRTGVHNDPAAKTRVVLDLNAQYDYTIQQIPSQKDSQFNIIVSQAGTTPAPLDAEEEHD
jgi:hypothetical protein